jgi:pimeloyl-ACP methyl ester carboxylesterase
LRNIPTEAYPDLPEDETTPVTLTTTKAQEVWTYLRPAYNPHSPNDPLSFKEMRTDDVLDPKFPFYRPESAQTFRQLPDVKPSVLYIFGSKSPLSPPEARKAKIDTTGSGAAGSGRTAEEVLVDAGHLIAFEKPDVVGEAIADFANRDLKRWESERNLFERRWKERERKDRAVIDAAWKEHIGAPPAREKRDRKGKL